MDVRLEAMLLLMSSPFKGGRQLVGPAVAQGCELDLAQGWRWCHVFVWYVFEHCGIVRASSRGHPRLKAIHLLDKLLHRLSRFLKGVVQCFSLRRIALLFVD